MQESNPGDRDLGKENLNGLNPSALLDSQKSTKCCRIKKIMSNIQVG